MQPRHLTDTERSIIERILDQDPLRTRELRAQLDQTEVVEEFGPGDPSIMLGVKTAHSPPSPLEGLPELVGRDDFGTTVHVQLHLSDGYLYELEFYAYGDQTLGDVEIASLRPASTWWREQAALKPDHSLEFVEEPVSLGNRELMIVRPRDAETLLDEEAFTHEEFLPYWAELWPSGVALACTVYERELTGARVLELGCGLALPSIAAALRGADVLATDWSPDALAVARLNAERNGVRLDMALCTWAEPDPLVQWAPWDVVLAADVLYERRNVEVLLDLLPRLVDERGEVLIADPGRPHVAAFLERAAVSWDLTTHSESASPRVRVYTMRVRGRGS